MVWESAWVRRTMSKGRHDIKVVGTIDRPSILQGVRCRKDQRRSQRQGNRENGHRQDHINAIYHRRMIVVLAGGIPGISSITSYHRAVIAVTIL